MKKKELIIYFAFIRETVAHPQLVREKKKSFYYDKIWMELNRAKK